MRRTHIEFLLQAHSDTLKMLAEAEYEVFDERGSGDFAQAKLDGKIQANAMFATFRLTLCKLMMSDFLSSVEEVGSIMQFPPPYPELQQKKERIAPS